MLAWGLSFGSSNCRGGTKIIKLEPDRVIKTTKIIKLEPTRIIKPTKIIKYNQLTGSQMFLHS